MRVTGIIKDYITSEIDKKYQEKLNTLPNEYEDIKGKCLEELDLLKEKTNLKANEICKKYNMSSKRENIFSYDSYYVRNDEMSDKQSQIIRTLRQEKSDKIAEIILGLELGETNKKELTNILKGVEF